MSPGERAVPAASPLKPRIKELARSVDRVADEVGIGHLEKLSRAIGCPIDLIVDPSAGHVHSIGRKHGREVIFAYMDAVDGTIKVGGLGNDLRKGAFRAANDGGWAAALAFTAPTTAAIDELRIGDFVAAALVDGNPTRYVTYPQELVTIPDAAGHLATFDVSGSTEWAGEAPPAHRVFTSSNTALSQTMAYLDSFQAFDRDTRRDGDEELAVELYRLLINRHDGGAFDILRQYANLNALQRTMLGWRDPPVWIEPQGSAFIVINENLFNLVPAVPLISGAGGLCLDFDDQPLAERRLVDGRTSAVHVANEAIRRTVLSVIAQARRRASRERRAPLTAVEE